MPENKIAISGHFEEAKDGQAGGVAVSKCLSAESGPTGAVLNRGSLVLDSKEATVLRVDWTCPISVHR